MTSATFDWDGLLRALVDGIRDGATEFRDDDGSEIYGIAVYGFYADGATISWPMIGVSGVDSEAADDPELRWSPYDWEYEQDPSDVGDDWSTRLSAFAGRDRGAHWDEAEARFFTTVVDACEIARRSLLADGLIPATALVIAADEGEELVPKCVTKAQLAEEFPHLAAEAAERDRIAALPIHEQIAALLDAIGADEDEDEDEDEDDTVRPVLDWESAPPLLYPLVESHPDAVLDALLHRLEVDPGPTFARRHLWMRTIEDLGVVRPDLISALTTIMNEDSDAEASRAAGILCRMGRTDAVADRYSGLPEENRSDFVRAFARPFCAPPHREAPLRSAPVDLAPLAAVLHSHPELNAALFDELGVNQWLGAEDVETYFAALDSEWSSIRRHAAWSLVFTRLVGTQRQRYAEALDDFENDPALAPRVGDLRRIFNE